MLNSCFPKTKTIQVLFVNRIIVLVLVIKALRLAYFSLLRSRFIGMSHAAKATISYSTEQAMFAGVDLHRPDKIKGFWSK